MAMAIGIPLLLIIVCISAIFSYPTYGSKRYGRNNRFANTPNSYRAPYQIRSDNYQSYPVNYYAYYPYSQNYPTADDYYYPQQSAYPMYYPRTSKYEVYQAVVPYYYQERPNPYYPLEKDPLAELQEETQEAEREEREEQQPIGHEVLYENEEDSTTNDNMDDVNAAFLQNLIMTQMYKDALKKKNMLRQSQRSIYQADEPYENDYDYTNYETSSMKQKQEDEDVKELKELSKNYDAEPNYKQANQNQKQGSDNIAWYQRNQEKRSSADHGDISHVPASIAKSAIPDRKSTNKEEHTTTVGPKRETRGQKEEFVMQPATPVRHPFPETVISTRDGERKRAPSVYDTIKHMLDIEKSLENKYGNEVRPTHNLKRSIISPEETLTSQLSLLKKTIP